MKRLEGTIVVVTGASRGGGRGIALALGDEGATVYVTGRSVRDDSTRPDLRSATIDETAERVSARGGIGIPVRCDHTDDDQVAALFDRVHSEQGRIDLLVNNVWGGYEDYASHDDFDRPFWEQPLTRWDKMFDAGVRAHFTASQAAARRMIPNRRGLIVSTTFWDRGKALSSLPYDVAKNAINRSIYDMALELRAHNIAAVAVSPGWMRTEAVLKQYGLPIDDSVRELPPDLTRTESVQYIGRAVAALACDPNVLKKSGQVFPAGDLAREYGFTDVDGSQPPAYRMADERLRD
jgi:NAD(P)-dependent dehydrogenase (short-subunit alcohol dehydrogenase family)